MENALRQLVCLVMGTLIIYLVIQNYFKQQYLKAGGAASPAGRVGRE